MIIFIFFSFFFDSFSILKFCNYFLFLSIFLFDIIFCFVFLFTFFLWQPPTNKKSVLWCDKSVIVESTDFFSFTKMPLYSFLRKWKYQKVLFNFCIQIYLFWILKWKLNTNTKPNKFLNSESHKKQEKKKGFFDQTK